MKTLILFATITNTCREITDYIEEKLNHECETVNLMINLDKINYEEYDNIVLGSYTHGKRFDKQFEKEIKRLSKLGKKHYVFVTGFNNNTNEIKKERLNKLSKGNAEVFCVGGLIRPEYAPSKIMRTILIQTKLNLEIDELPLPTIDYSEVDKLVEILNSNNN